MNSLRATLSIALALVLAVSLVGSAVSPATAAAVPQDDDPYVEALSRLRYRAIGPANMGGRVSAIVGVPGNRDVWWFGGADGGVWKTTDGGVTWEGQWQDAEAYSVGALALAPSDHNVLWLGSGEGDPRNSVSYGLGVWRSVDGGKTWDHLGLEDTERIHRIVVDPRDADTALVCAMGHEWGPNEQRGVFKTTDGGETWDKVLYIDQDTGCSDMDIDLSNPRNVYAGMWTFRRKPWRFDDGGKETALYVSRDMGETWEKIESTPDEPMARIGVGVAQSSPNVVYLITEYPTAGTLFRSDDYGETWQMVNDERNINFRPFYYSDVYVDPSDENTVYTLSGGLFKSTDGGRNFDHIAFGVHGDHQGLWIDPTDSDYVLSGSDGGYQVTYDAGESFHIWRQVVLSQFYQIFFDDRDPYYVCGGLQDNGNWCGPNRSKAGRILMDDWYTVSGGDGFYTVPVPGKPHLVYSNAQGGYFRITDTRTGRTRSIEPYPRMMGSQGQGMYQAKYRFNWDAPIHISPHDPNTVYWGGNVLFRSTDQGYSFDVISPDLTTDDPDKQLDSGGEIYLDNTAAEFHTTILTVAEDRMEPGVIWVGTDDGNVQVTRDGGDDWTLINENIPDFPQEAWVAKIDASHHDAGTAYIAVDQHRLDDFTPHAWRCTDYGASCEKISGGLPGDDYVKVVREDPVNPDLLYVGMDRGLFISWDGGDSWHDMRLNLPPVSVRDIKIHPRDNDLIVGTHGRGAWILDDLAPLQELPEALEADVHLFDIPRATNWESWNKDSSLGNSTWTGENPPDGALISFYVAEAPAGRGGDGGSDGPPSGFARFFGGGAGGGAMQPADGDTGQVTVRITDGEGNLVRELAERNISAGVNRVTWDLQHEGPEPVPGQQGGGGFFSFFGGGGGPPALPGTYTATVVANGQEVSKSFELRGDPDVQLSMADWQALHDAGMRARDLRSTVNRMIGTVSNLTDQIENLREQVTPEVMDNVEAIREQVGTALQQLEDLDDKLQRPPPDMGYRQYPRLSEELSRLDRSITGVQARPTEGQMTVLGELANETQERVEELNDIISTTIEELNGMLEGYPKVITGWDGGGGGQ